MERNRKAITLTNLTLFYMFLVSIFFGTSNSISILGKTFSPAFWISLIGIPLFVISYIFIYRTKSLNKLLINIGIVFIVLFANSLVMSIVLFPFFNGYLGTNPIIVCVKSAFKYVYDFVCFAYVVFFIKTISKKEIDIIMYGLMALWIIVAGIQFVVYKQPNGVIATIYDKLDVFDILVDSSLIDKARYEGFRVYSFLAEPSVNCTFIPIYVIPFLVYKILRNPKNIWNLVINGGLTLSFILAVFLTKSSAVYATFAALMLALLYLVFQTEKLKKRYKLLLMGFALAFIVVLFIVPSSRNLIMYYFIEKVFSTNNLSSAYRYSSVYNDLLLFIKMPLFGCGDGLQGYFYFQNIAGTQMTISYETINSLYNKMGLLNGGAMIPSFVSGFGVIGCLIICYMCRNFFKKFKKQSLRAKYKYSVYICAFFAMFVAGIVAIGIHRNYPLFVFMAVPFCSEESNISLDEKIAILCKGAIVVSRKTTIC